MVDVENLERPPPACFACGREGSWTFSRVSFDVDGVLVTVTCMGCGAEHRLHALAALPPRS